MTPEQLIEQVEFFASANASYAVAHAANEPEAAANFASEAMTALLTVKAEIEALGVISIALDVAQAALHRIHDRPDMPPSIRTITEHALRNERWDDTIPPGGWVCAIDSRPSESEPCPQHGHTGAPWCCDTCKTFLEANNVSHS